MSGDAVAPAHAVVFELDKKHHIRDLGTHGGTFINDQPVGVALVADSPDLDAWDLGYLGIVPEARRRDAQTLCNGAEELGRSESRIDEQDHGTRLADAINERS